MLDIFTHAFGDKQIDLPVACAIYFKECGARRGDEPDEYSPT